MRRTIVIGTLLQIVPALAIAASVELRAALDKPFCDQVAHLFQLNMNNGNRLDQEAASFGQIKWEPAVIAGTGPPTRRCSRLDRAVVDLDNDGAYDLVVRATSCMKGSPSDSLYVFPSDSHVLEQSSWQNLAPLLDTGNKFERTGGSYPLTAIPFSSGPTHAEARLSTVFTVHPFLLGEKAYLALTDRIGEWIVVAKYLGGERLEDLCYLKTNDTSK